MVSKDIQTVKNKTEELLDIIQQGKNPAMLLDTATVLLEMGMRKFLRERDKICKDCKK